MGLLTATAEEIVLYWKPGCSSCLRMMEFVEGTKLSYAAVNVDAEPEQLAMLLDAGLLGAPAARVDGRWIVGLDLEGLAESLGIAYDGGVSLTSAELYAKYNVVMDALCRYLAQLPPEALAWSLPGRKRSIRIVANQSAAVARAFLSAYYKGAHDISLYDCPAEVQTAEDLIERALETRDLVGQWWDKDGFDDPLDHMIETNWGNRTLLEIFEREVWHTAQHTRQMMYVLGEFGISPDGPLTAEDLAGLPLPDRIHD